MKYARIGHNVCRVDGQIFVMGGADEEMTTIMNSVEKLTNCWEEVEPMPRPCYGTTAIDVG